MESIETYHMPPAAPLAHPTHHGHPAQRAHSLLAMKPQWQVIIPQSPQLTWGPPPGAVQSMGLDNCVMTRSTCYFRTISHIGTGRGLSRTMTSIPWVQNPGSRGPMLLVNLGTMNFWGLTSGQRASWIYLWTNATTDVQCRLAFLVTRKPLSKIALPVAKLPWSPRCSSRICQATCTCEWDQGQIGRVVLKGCGRKERITLAWPPN